MAKLAGKNQYLRKINISEVGGLCRVKHRGNIMYREEKHIDGPSGPGANRSTNNNNTIKEEKNTYDKGS
jgi:hypothetical protein